MRPHLNSHMLNYKFVYTIPLVWSSAITVVVIISIKSNLSRQKEKNNNDYLLFADPW